MWRFQIESAILAIKRFPGLSALIVLAIALGLAATMSTATIVWRLADDPIPKQSQRLHYVMLDAWDEGGFNDDGTPPDQLTFPDAMALFDSAPAERQAPMYRLGFAIQPERADINPSQEFGRATSRHFFDMFEYRIVEGSAWSATDERDGTSVVLIERQLKEKLFGNEPALGKELTGNNERFKIIGVYEAPQRVVQFHDVTQGALTRRREQFILPIRTAIRLQLDTWGNNNCWKPFDNGYIGKTKSECIWLQYWVDLQTPAEIARYQQFIDNYADQQRTLGRFPNSTRNNHLANVADHMRRQEVVSRDQRLSSWVGLGFLLIAVVNAMCLMLAKFLRGSHTAAVHRALGASRSTVLRQHLIEAGLFGVISAVLGVLLTWLALIAMRWTQEDLQSIAVMDWKLLSAMLLMSLGATLLAGLLPAWRVSRLAPAASLRSN
jgi:putative ABC transport system permease protein